MEGVDGWVEGTVVVTVSGTVDVVGGVGDGGNDVVVGAVVGVGELVEVVVVGWVFDGGTSVVVVVGSVVVVVSSDFSQ